MSTDMLLITASTGHELFSGINIEYAEWPWTFKIRGFGVFLSIFSCDAHTNSELRWNGWRSTVTICEQELLRLSSISWALLKLLVNWTCRGFVQSSVRVGKNRSTTQTVAYLGGTVRWSPPLARPWKFFTGDFIWKGAFFAIFQQELQHSTMFDGFCVAKFQKNGRICGFHWTFRSKKCFSFRGLRLPDPRPGALPLDPAGGSAPRPPS